MAVFAEPPLHSFGLNTLQSNLFQHQGVMPFGVRPMANRTWPTDSSSRRLDLLMAMVVL